MPVSASIYRRLSVLNGLRCAHQPRRYVYFGSCSHSHNRHRMNLGSCAKLHVPHLQDHVSIYTCEYLHYSAPSCDGITPIFRVLRAASASGAVQRATRRKCSQKSNSKPAGPSLGSFLPLPAPRFEVFLSRRGHHFPCSSGLALRCPAFENHPSN